MHHPTERITHIMAIFFCYTSCEALAGMRNSSVGTEWDSNDQKGLEVDLQYYFVILWITKSLIGLVFPPSSHSYN